MGRTCCVQKLFWISKTIPVHNMFCPCSELGIFMYWTCNSKNNSSSYCGLVDAKKRASEKNLPVAYTLYSGHVNCCKISFIKYSWIFPNDMFSHCSQIHLKGNSLTAQWCILLNRGLSKTIAAFRLLRTAYKRYISKQFLGSTHSYWVSLMWCVFYLAFDS